MQPAAPAAGQTVSRVHMKATHDAGQANGTAAANSMRMTVSRLRLAHTRLACSHLDLRAYGLRFLPKKYAGAEDENTTIHCASLPSIQ